MPFVKGITQLNAQDKLQEAKQALTNAVNEGASDKQLEELAKVIINIETTIKSLDTRQRNNYDKLSPKEKLVVDAQKKHNEEIYEKEKRERKEKEEREKRAAEERIKKQEELQKQRWNSIHDSVVNVGNSLSKGVNEIADKSFHALLGPLNLLVNPLEKALNFNLFDIGKKTAVDILTLPIKPLRDDITKKGGLIGATGIFIADTITKGLNKLKGVSDEELSSDSGAIESMKNAVLTGASSKVVSGLAAAAKWAAPVVAGLAIVGAGVAVAWKNEWDKKGPEIVDEVNAAAQTPEFLDDFTVAVKQIGMAFFGGVAGAIRNFSSNREQMNKYLFGSEKPENILQNIISSVAGFGKGQLDTWATYSPYVQSLVDSIDNVEGEYYSAMEALKIVDPNSPLFDKVTDAQDLVYAENKLQKLGKSTLFNNIQNLIRTGQYSVKQIGDNAYSLVDSEGDVVNLDEFGNIISRKASLAVNSIINPKLSVDNMPTGFKEIFDSSTSEQQTAILRSLEQMNAKQQIIGNASQLSIEDINALLSNIGKSVNDAIITKNNDVYIPSPDDNIVLTKNEPDVQNTNVNTSFQKELMSVLREIANNLRQPTIVNNNMGQSGVLNFEGFRL